MFIVNLIILGGKTMTNTPILVGLATAFAVASTPVTTTLAASPYAKVPSNNGTIKVHEKDTPANTESNDPKVCIFNFEGYGFDAGQSGTIVISTDLNSKDKVGTKQLILPAADVNGYTETEYVTIPAGHYKTTVYGKDTHGDTDYNNDLKAKSKVIKVSCESNVVTPVTPTTPVTPVVQLNSPQTPAILGVTSARPAEHGHILGEAAQTTALPEALPVTGDLTNLIAWLMIGLSSLTYATLHFLRRRSNA